MTRCSQGRVFGLDLLRAFAVLVVVYGHGYPLVEDYVSKGLYKNVLPDGVNLFFVLSGFLIGRILLQLALREDFGRTALLDFWVRRWFRTVPAYMFVLLLLIAASALLGAGRKLPPDLVAFFFFSQNIAWRHPAFFPEAWSLAVEEWFYLIVPILFLLATRLRGVDRRRVMLVLVIGVIVAVTAYRLWRVAEGDYASQEQWAHEIRKQVLTRLDSLMFGVLGAYLSLHHAERWARAAPLALVCGLAMLVLDGVCRSVSPGLFYLGYFTLTVSPLATLLLLPALSGWKTAVGPLARAVTFVSLISYSLYLLHLSVVQHLVLPAVEAALREVCWRCAESGLLLYALYWSMSISAAWLLYSRFERPMTELRERFSRRQQTHDRTLAQPRSVSA